MAPVHWQGYINGFLKYLEGLGYSSATVNTRRHHLVRATLLLDSGTTIESVTTNELLEYILRVPSKAYKRSARTSLVKFFEWVQLQGIRGDNPAESLPVIRAPKPHPKPCPDKYIKEALEKATAEETIMVLLASEMGLRRGEIAQVHTDDVSGVPGAYALIVHGKGERQRVLPCPDELAEVIMAAGGYIFPGRFNGHVEESYIGKRISKLLPDGYSAHKLRHRFATKAYEHNHDIMAVKEALGHENVNTTQYYVAFNPHMLTDTLQYTTDLPAGKLRPEKVYAPKAPAADFPHADFTAETATDKDKLAAWLILLQGGTQAARSGSHSFRLRLDELEDMINQAEKVRMPSIRRGALIRRGARLLEFYGFLEIKTDEKGYLGANFIERNLTACKKWWNDYMDDVTSR